MTDTPLILRTEDLFIRPIPEAELERLGNHDFETSDHHPEQDNEEKAEFEQKIGLLSEKDPLSGDSIFFGGRMSDRSDTNERKHLKRELCAEISAKLCQDGSRGDPDQKKHSEKKNTVREGAEAYIWNTVWRVCLRTNPKEQVGLFRFLGPQEKGRVGFELVIFPEYRHMGYARQLITKMTSFAFDKNDVYYLYSRIPETQEPEEYERVLRRSGFRTEKELFDPFEASKNISDDEIMDHEVPDLLIKEAAATSYSSAYIMIGLCIGMVISLYSGLMLEGLAGGLIFATLLGAILDHFELRHRRNVINGKTDDGLSD